MDENCHCQAGLGLFALLMLIPEKKDTIGMFKMSQKWPEKENNATARNLYNCLKDISVEIQDVLGFL